MRSIAIAFVVSAANLAVFPADADVARGADLAKVWCGSCHVVSASRAGSFREVPPSLREIARRGMTPDHLRAFLSHPHGAMPDLSLSRAEIADLIDYIEALRRASGQNPTDETFHRSGFLRIYGPSRGHQLSGSDH
jgi:mono/diheme cytochrome c family protein